MLYYRAAEVKLIVFTELNISCCSSVVHYVAFSLMNKDGWFGSLIA